MPSPTIYSTGSTCSSSPNNMNSYYESRHTKQVGTKRKNKMDPPKKVMKKQFQNEMDPRWDNENSWQWDFKDKEYGQQTHYQRPLVSNMGRGRSYTYSMAELQAVYNYKTKICEFYDRNCCRRGDNCAFAHGAKQLRTRGIVAGYINIEPPSMDDMAPLAYIPSIFQLES